MAIMRSVYDSLMPRGPIYNPVKNGHMDKLTAGRADNADLVFDDMTNLAYIRNPYKIPAILLPDLEKEFGIQPRDSVSTSLRRSNLASIIYKTHQLATIVKLQAALDVAGFGTGGYGLIVTPNNLVSNPEGLVANIYQMVANDFDESGITQCAGNSEAYCAVTNGYYLVNGDAYTSAPAYPGAGTDVYCRAFDGSDSLSGTHCAGYYASYTQYTNEYDTPSEDYWGLIFFVGGETTYNTDGTIAAIAPVDVPATRRQDLHKIILRIKPQGMWAGMVVIYS